MKKPTIFQTLVSLNAVIFAVAIALSYSTQYETALLAGFGEWEARLYPLIVDAFIALSAIALTYSAVVRSMLIRLTAYTLLLAYSLLSIAINVHAAATLTALALHLVPPLTVFFSTELLRMVLSEAQRQQADTSIRQATAAVIKEHDTALQELANIRQATAAAEQELDSIRQEATTPPDEANIRRGTAAVLFAKGYTTQQVADVLGVTPTTVRRYRNDLNGTVKALKGKLE